MAIPELRFSPPLDSPFFAPKFVERKAPTKLEVLRRSSTDSGDSATKIKVKEPKNKSKATQEFFFPRASERRVLQKEGGVNRSTYKRYLLTSSRI